MCAWTRRLLLGVGAALAGACGGGGGEPTETPCVGDDCPCESAQQCPGRRGCYAGTCYRPGEFPRQAACVDDADCLDRLCERDQHRCTNSCNPANAGPCPSGWGCYQTGACLELNSLPHGALCNLTSLCPVGDTCLNTVCETVCSVGYDTAAPCAPGSYCSVNPTPVCLESQCDPSATNTCVAPAVCVDLGAGVGVCRGECSYSYNPSYADTCSGGIGYYGATCAPLGVAEASVCIEAAAAGGSAGLPGAPCNGGTQLCKRGNICLSGHCHKLCWAQTSCTTGTCTEISPGSDFRVCL